MNLELNDYPNMLDFVSLSSDKITSTIKDYPLSFSQNRSVVIENDDSLPIFLIPFYKYVYKNNSVPTQKEFCELYFSENKQYFESRSFSDELIESLKARAFRTYPSLVRDLHFSFLLKEAAKEADVIYNTTLDTTKGIDILIKYRDQLYGFNLFTDTKLAKKWREKKDIKHKSFDNVKYFDIPLDLNAGERCGKFFLYGKNELKKIKEIINQKSEIKEK